MTKEEKTAELTTLKAQAYDQLAIREQVDRNLAAINQKIMEVSQVEETPEPAKVDSEQPAEA